ncbi:hypothetical protein BJQ97_03148 [Geobacillus sp. TFV-3]|nr:hypothetical protein BJQ97_03148 [Geobacillus sp. TFV-3]
MTPEHLHVVLSTDRKLSDEEILRCCVQRWTIECFFRQAKDQLKLGGYCVRHIRAVKRYWAVVLPSCVYSIAESQQTLSAGLELLQSRKGHSVVEFIYDAAKQDIPIDVIKKQLRIA